jgi:hypothetical protein
MDNSATTAAAWQRGTHLLLHGARQNSVDKGEQLAKDHVGEGRAGMVHTLHHWRAWPRAAGSHSVARPQAHQVRRCTHTHSSAMKEKGVGQRKRGECAWLGEEREVQTGNIPRLPCLGESLLGAVRASCAPSELPSVHGFECLPLRESNTEMRGTPEMVTHCGGTSSESWPLRATQASSWGD